MRVWGNRSLGCRPASTQKRAAGFGRQTKVCSPSAAPKGDGVPIAPRPRRSGPRVSGGNLRIARPQPPLKGTALQSPRVHAKAGRGFRAAIKDCQPSAAPQGVGAHQSGSLSRLPRKPIGEGQNVGKRRSSPLTKRLIRWKGLLQAGKRAAFFFFTQWAFLGTRGANTPAPRRLR